MASLHDFILSHENDDITELALKAKVYPDVDMTFVLQQIKGRQVFKKKVPLWYHTNNIIYPPSISLEQSSSEATARYKASLFSGGRFVDLTGGIGIDFSFISRNFNSSVYVETNENLVKIAKDNFQFLGLRNVEIHKGDASDFIENNGKFDLIYIDPARRDKSGKKTIRIEDCTPNVIAIEKLLDMKGDHILIKFSPMLDISRAIDSLKNIIEIHIVSNKNECKELLFVKGKKAVPCPVFYCVDIKGKSTSLFKFTKDQECDSVCKFAETVENYLYEPNASILKAGAFKIVSERFSLKKLHPNSHLYTSNRLMDNFPGRIFKVFDDFSMNKNDLKSNLSGVDKANISVRNFPLSPEELQQKLKMKTGGDIFIFATTLYDGKKRIIRCHKIDNIIV